MTKDTGEGRLRLPTYLPTYQPTYLLTDLPTYHWLHELLLNFMSYDDLLPVLPTSTAAY